VNVRLATIGDFVEPVATWNPATKPAITFSYVDLGAVDQADKKITSATSVRGAEAPSRARQLIRKGDILVSTVRPNLNGVAPVTEELDGATASTGFCVLRPRREKLSSTYLLHWVRSPRFVDLMVRQATGASYPAVSDRIIKGSLIPLPSLEEQRRISAILDKADALRRTRRRVLTLLDSFTRSIFFEMFGRRNDPIVELKDAVRKGTIVTYGIVQAGPEYAGGIPYIRTGDIIDGQVQRDGLRRTNPAIAERFSRSRVEAGDIVMSIRATVGTTAVVPEELDGANLTQGTARIAPGERTLLNYLVEYLRSEQIQCWISAQVKGVTFLEITLGRLRQLPVALPPIDLQERFSNIANRIIDQRLICSRQFSLADSFFSSLQHRAFSGQL